MNAATQNHIYPIPADTPTADPIPPCDTPAPYSIGPEPHQRYPTFPRPDPIHVCPHCKVPTEIYLVTCDVYSFETHRCRTHGEIVPILSHVQNPKPAP